MIPACAWAIASRRNGTARSPRRRSIGRSRRESEMKLPTKLRLAAALREAAAQAGPQNAAKYEAFAKRAETGEFDDFADTYVCPITQINNELMAAGFTKFAARVRDGEFDATKEESDAWAASTSGQEAYRMLTEKRPTLRDAAIEDHNLTMMQGAAAALDDAFNGDAT